MSGDPQGTSVALPGPFLGPLVLYFLGHLCPQTKPLSWNRGWETRASQPFLRVCKCAPHPRQIRKLWLCVCKRCVRERFVRSRLILPETNFQVVKYEASCLRFILIIPESNRLEGPGTAARTWRNLGLELALSDLSLGRLSGMLGSSGVPPQWAGAICPPPNLPCHLHTRALPAWTLTSAPLAVCFLVFSAPQPQAQIFWRKAHSYFIRQ